MDLKTYIAAERGRATSLANILGISPSYLSQLASGKAPISPERAVAIERATDGACPRPDLVENWQSIWPELVDSKKMSVGTDLQATEASLAPASVLPQ